MPELYPYQHEGAAFLADRKRALLADEPRVGKTPSAIRAADYALAEDILEITKGSARRDHTRAWERYQWWPRRVTPVYTGADAIPNDGVVIASYDLATGPLFDRLFERRWDAIVLDESHRLKNREATRTQRVFGEKCDGDGGLVERADLIWPLSGTPFPNNYSEIWSTARAVFPAAIEIDGKPMSYSRFVQRFCVQQDNGFGLRITGNRNAADLRARLAPYMLRRSFAEVWPDTPEPIFDELYLDAAENLKAGKDREFEALVAEYEARLRAADGDEERTALILKEVETRIGARLQRITGEAKVPAMAAWAADRLDDGLEKIVLFAWHREVIAGLAEALKRFRPAVLWGGMPPRKREDLQDAFQQDPRCRVAIGQIVAAGEAIDLSAADDLVFVEASWNPGDNDQARRRIQNTEKRSPTTVWFATLAGSIDERVQRANAKKIADIAKVLG